MSLSDIGVKRTNAFRVNRQDVPFTISNSQQVYGACPPNGVKIMGGGEGIVFFFQKYLLGSMIFCEKVPRGPPMFLGRSCLTWGQNPGVGGGGYSMFFLILNIG